MGLSNEELDLCEEVDKFSIEEYQAVFGHELPGELYLYALELAEILERMKKAVELKDESVLFEGFDDLTNDPDIDIF